MKNDRYNRSEYYPTVNVNGVLEKDMLKNKFREYAFKKPFMNYKMKYEDYLRPDLISKKVYGTMEYWWLILRCNPELEDIWNDYGYSNETVRVYASDIDPSINKQNDYLIDVDKQEYTYPNAIKVGDYINLPSLEDIQDFYSFSKAN